MWMEEHGERINKQQDRPGHCRGGRRVAVGCLLADHDDGRIKDRNMEEKMAARDIAGVVWEGHGCEGVTPGSQFSVN